jgi:hypothetical protein
MMQDLIVEDVNRQMLFLGETYIQVSAPRAERVGVRRWLPFCSLFLPLTPDLGEARRAGGGGAPGSQQQARQLEQGGQGSAVRPARARHERGGVGVSNDAWRVCPLEAEDVALCVGVWSARRRLHLCTGEAGRAAWGTTAAWSWAWERGPRRMHRAGRWRMRSGAAWAWRGKRCGAARVGSLPCHLHHPSVCCASLSFPGRGTRSPPFLVTPPPSRWARSPSSPRWAVLSTRRAPAATHLPLPAPRAPRAPAATARDSTHSIVRSARGARAP